MTTESAGATTASAAASSSSAAVADSKTTTVKKDESKEASTNKLLVASYLTIAGFWVASLFVVIPLFVHVVGLVAAILYAACHGSLILREKPDPNVAESEQYHVEREVMKKEDAYQFPLIGSCTLFGLYLAFRFLEPWVVNMLIGFYFGIISLMGLAVTFSPVVSRVMPQHLEQTLGWEYKQKHSLPEWLAGPSPWDLGVEFSLSDIVCLILAGVIVFFYFSTRAWYLNNILAFCFCIQAIERFSLGTYQIGAILLIGLFFYDIFWVFGTDVMVTVAKSVDGPIKILFPRSLERNAETGKLDMNLLGLGDIVIPGFFLSILLRFDAHIAKQPIHSIDIHSSFPKPYFHTTLFFYCLGLATTLGIMFFFNAAQPALLYLVPACLGSSFVCAFVRGETKELMEYSEEEEEGEEEGKESADAAGKKEDSKVASEDKKDK